MLLCENDSHRYSIYKADFIQKHLRMALIDAGHLASLQINYNPCFFCNFSQRYLLFLHY